VDAGLERRRNQILTLTNEELEALALAAGGQATHELEARIRGGGDHASHSSH
jgi:hypothetical protein